MNAIDILGGLLGGGSKGRSGGGGLGGKILGELLKGATGGGLAPQPAPAPAPQPSRGRPTSTSSRPVDIESEARSLEEMLGVATGSSRTNRTAPEPSSYRPAPEPRYQPQQRPQQQRPQQQPAPSYPTQSFPAPSQPSSPWPNQPSSASMTTDDEAIVLIRALINAAKADGRVDTNEQQAILSQVPNDAQTINFLKQEFAQPLDVREFAWSVPLGMEVKVYTMSLAGMQLDTNTEARYLQELAHGLRMDPDLCRQIHAKYGLGDIF